jgi:iron complex transport system permease protein
LALLVLGCFMLHLFVGSVHLPLSDVLRALIAPSSVDGNTLTIVRDIRLPQAVAALTAGAGLAVCGLLMQTLFRNPLAGPSVLGISSGASLGVALVMLAGGALQLSSFTSPAALIVAGSVGSATVLLLVLWADRRVGDGTTLLIVGLLISYLCSAFISVLQASSSADALKGFVVWGMGTFAAVAPQQLAWFGVPVLLGLLMAALAIKPLNALLLGEDHARSVGVEVAVVRTGLLMVTGLLAGVITAFCGPIAFVGMVTPHIARALLRTGDHARLLPATLLCGSLLALFADLVARSGWLGGPVPLNSVTSLMGVPVVMWVLFSGKRWVRST